MKFVSTVVAPAALLVVAALAAERPEIFPDSLPAFLRLFPWVVLAAGVVLGLRFRRGRAFLAFVAVATADQALQRVAPALATDGAARFAFDAVAVLLPANLAAIVLLPEIRVPSARGLGALGAIVAQPALMAFLWLSYHPGLAAALRHEFALGWVVPGLRLAQPAVLAFGFALAAVAILGVRRRATLDGGFAWLIAAVFLALTVSHSAARASIYLTAGQLILLVFVVEAVFAMAFRDGLTGLPSRRALDETLATLSGRYTVAMADIDHFKEVNDRHGHDVGDQVLRMVAAHVDKAPDGRAFRYGGEEFAVVFAGKTRAEVLPDLEAMRKAIGEASFTLRSDDRPKKKPKEPRRPAARAAQLSVTVSIGAAEAGPRQVKPDEVMKAADAALYRAKQGGRNRVVS